MSPAIGFRVWRIDQMLTGPCLASPNRYMVWSPDAPVMARCVDVSGAPNQAKLHKKEPHTAPPIETCTCGIYAYHDADQMAPAISSQLVGGAILAWGRVTIHREGFRAQFARPLALCYPQTLPGSTAASLARLAALYRLPVLDIDHIAVFAAEFGQCLGPEIESSDDWTIWATKPFRRLFGSWFHA